MNFKTQLKALLWKNYILKKRNKTRLALEIIWPLSMFLIFFFIRVQKDFSEKIPNCYFTERPLPSSGLVPFLRAFICELNQTCYSTQIDENYDGQFFLTISSLVASNIEIIRLISNIKIPLIIDQTNDDAQFNLTRLFKIDYQELLLQETRKSSNTCNNYKSDRYSMLNTIEKQVDDLLMSKTNFNLSLIKHKLCHNKINAKTSFLKEFCASNLFGLDKLLSSLTSEENEKALFVLKLLFFQKRLIQKSSLIQQFVNNSLEILHMLQDADIEKIICGQSPLNIFKLIKKYLPIKQTSQSLVDMDLDSSSNEYIKIIKRLNKYNTLNDTCPLNVSLNGRQCFCENIRLKIISSESSLLNLLWNRIEWLINGYIYITPRVALKGSAYDRLINKLNTTFAHVDSFVSRINDLHLFLRDLKTFQRNARFFNQLLPERRQVDLYLLESIHYDSLKELIHFTTNMLKCINLNRIKEFESENEIESKLNENEKSIKSSNDMWAALVFDAEINENYERLPSKLKYKIRMNATQTQSTLAYSDTFYKFGARNCLTCNKDFTYGFIYLQDLLEKSIVEIKINHTYDYELSTQMTPYPCYTQDNFIAFIMKILPILMVLAWIFTVSMLVKDIVYEKEKRLREFMRVMGLGNQVHLTAWFINTFILMISICFCLCLIIKYGNMTRHTDVTPMLVFFGCFTCATISQCFLISVFFDKANLAAAVSAIAYFLGFLPFMLLVNFSDVISLREKLVACLSSNVAFSYGFDLIGIFELQQKGLKWSNFAQLPLLSSTSTNDSFSMLHICCILLFDSFVYLCLAWYIDQIWPGEYGTSRPWYFIFGLTKLRVNKYTKEFIKKDQKEEQEQEEDEGEEGGKEIGIEIRNLHKIYDNGVKNRFHALNGINAKFYKNEITSLLGHNGAGKSTLMNILTGIHEYTQVSATHTQIKINGICLTKHNINKIRQECIGYVPQYNILFDKLTVYEHLLFYSYLKNTSILSLKDTIVKQIQNLLDDTQLHKHKHKYAYELSGGMKRRLSVAIAFVGMNSRICILDEPSAGVDPLGRRGIWNLLFKYKLNRTIIISTHHMDEADILGDRLCILSHGKCIQQTTSFNLKKKCSLGYKLTLVKNTLDHDKDNHDKDTNTQITNLSLKDTKIYTWIKSKINGAHLISDSKKSSQNELLVFRLPINEIKHYEALFLELETNLDKFNIKSMSIQDTTLEEIFINICKKQEEQQEENSTQTNHYSNSNEENTFKRQFKNKLKNHAQKLEQAYYSLTKRGKYDTNVGEKTFDNENNEDWSCKRVESVYKLYGQQMKALWLKRYCRMKRNLKGLLAELALPILFIMGGLLVATYNPKFEQRPSLELHPWLNKDVNKIFISEGFNYNINNKNNQNIKRIVSSFIESPSVGNRCIQNYSIVLNRYSDKSRLTRVKHKLECLRESYVLVSGESKPPLNVKQWLDSSNYSTLKRTLDCTCSSGFPECALGYDGDIDYRQVYKLKTTDVLVNLTQRNVSDWLIKTEFDKKYFDQRFGGYEFIDLNNEESSSSSSISYLWSFLKSSIFNNLTQDEHKTKIKIWFNNKGRFSSVAYLNTLNNAILRAHLPIDENVNEHGIIAINHPFSTNTNDLDQVLTQRIIIDFFVAISLVFGLSFIPASFLVFLVEERESGSKQLQFVSNLKPIIYWLSNFTWDLANYFVPCLVCTCMFLWFDMKSFVSNENFVCLLLLSMAYGWACIPMNYLMNYYFRIPSTAFVVSSCSSVFIAILTTMSTIILEALSDNDNNLDLLFINNILKITFTLVFPQFCLARAIIDMSILYYISYTKYLFGLKSVYSSLAYDHIGKFILALFIQGCVFMTILLLIEYKSSIFTSALNKIFPLKQSVLKHLNEDDDVKHERMRVDTCDDYLKLKQIRKTYRNFYDCARNSEAVRGISLGLSKGDCFGLIGYNGAGKTTTFKMITGEISLTSGSIQINNNNNNNNASSSNERQHSIGYCPQKDALFDLLTCSEHIEYYLSIRGITHVDTRLVEYILRKINLNEYSSKITKHLSAGNKRKLSTAMASLCGQTSIVCLDEPTSGMDAKSKRLLWNDIRGLIDKRDRLIILTSHSMDECEQLCNKICIMKNGLFKCLGSPSYIKSKYGNGYKCQIRLANSMRKTSLISLFMTSFSSFMIKIVHLNDCLLEITIINSASNAESNIKLSYLFSILENNCKQMEIRDYSINEITLDEIFVNLATTMDSDLFELKQ